MPSDEPWMAVATGFWITDEQLAYRLDVTAPTIRRWRLRLERLGYLRCEFAGTQPVADVARGPVAAGLVNRERRWFVARLILPGGGPDSQLVYPPCTSLMWF